MRYGFIALACVALAATSLAAPVIDMRGLGVTVCTEYTTIVVTQTISPSNVIVPTPGHQPENYSTRRPYRFSGSFSSSTVAPTVPSSSIQSTTPVTTSATPTSETTSPVVTPTTSTTAPVVAPTTSTTAPVVTPTTSTTAPVVISTTSTTAPAAVTPASSFAAVALAAHNEKRALHGCPNLVWDDTMASYAQSITDKCIFQHSGGPYGENLAAGYPDPAAAIGAWYGEEPLYDYAAGQFSESTGHFTQVVWKSATKVGCAKTSCNTNTTPGDMFVCEYDTGNVIGFFIQNVPRPLSSSS